MKTGKKILFALLLTAGILGCEQDDSPETLPAPRVDFTFSPASPVEGDEVIFDAEQRAGSSEIVSWSWDFGDSESTTSNEIDPTFVYDESGTYNVTLEVTDQYENVYRTSKPVTVTRAEFPASIVWNYTTETQVSNINDGSSAPVVGDDGTVYYVESRAGAESKVVAVRDNGSSAELLWASNAIGAELPNAPSIGPDGNILINAWHDDFAINKLNAQDGSLMWSGAIDTDVSNNTPAVDSQGNIYHGSRAQGSNGGVYSWTSEGEKRWEITGVGAFYAAPAISADESVVYFYNSSDGKVWAVDTEDGTERWESPVGLDSGIHGTSLSIGPDGTIYFTSNTHVVAVSDEGKTATIKWQTEVNDASNSGVVVGPNGDLYVGSRGGLVSLNPDSGSINWTYNAEIAESVPAVDINGNIYVGTVNGTLLIIEDNGGLQKEFELGSGVVNSPTIKQDGTVYVEVFDNNVIRLFKLAVDGGGIANSAWPMKGQDLKNTGKAEN